MFLSPDLDCDVPDFAAFALRKHKDKRFVKPLAGHD
jgi:hypothetical protein